jgi:hypothetical protein
MIGTSTPKTPVVQNEFGVSQHGELSLPAYVLTSNLPDITQMSLLKMIWQDPAMNQVGGLHVARPNSLHPFSIRRNSLKFCMQALTFHRRW